MQIDITFKNMESSPALKDYVSKRISKISKYLDKPAKIHVILSVQKIRHKAEIIISSDGFDMTAAEITEDMYSAIDMVIDKIERQVKKHKDKAHVRKGSKVASGADLEAQEQKTKPKKSVSIIKEKNFFIMPMSIDEASMQISVAKKAFVVFQDSASGKPCLLYKRADKNLGLIEL